MSKITGNEAAFPYQYKGKNQFDWDEIKYGYGMTLRQYYAGVAMQGLCANHKWTETINGDDWDEYQDRLTEASVSIADAIIVALNKTPQ